MKMFVLMLKLVLSVVLMLCITTAPAFGAGLRGSIVYEPDSLDFLTRLLQKELNENFVRYADSLYVPYYMSFRVNDVTSLEINSNMGAVSGLSQDRNIYFVPQIRIGDEDFDNFIDLQNGAPSNMQHPPAAVFLPLNYSESSDVVCDIVRKELDSRYDFACRALEAARAKVAAGNVLRDTTGAFTVAPVVQNYETPSDVPDVDIEYWKNKVAELSRLFLNNKDIVNATVTFHCEFRRVLFLSSEGTLVAENRPYIMLSVNAFGLAEDGMSLPLHKNYFAFSFEELPSEEELRADVDRLSAKISELVVAPVAKAYSGPALLSGAAAGVFFHEIFGHRIEGQRLKSDFDGQTFKHMTGQRILPESLSVMDDPSLRYFKGVPLYGYYRFDDQGVAGERTLVVEDGILRNFLMTRTPINGHFRSNGHARADFVNDPTSRQSNLIVESSEELDDEQMISLLKEHIAAEGKEFGFYFKEVTGGLTQISSMAVNSFNVYPLEVYRVYADERERELVRGVDLIGTPLSMFSNILRAGGTYEVFTGLCGASSGNIPVTSVSPSILVSKVEVQGKPKSTATPYILERVPEHVMVAGKGSDCDEGITGVSGEAVIFRAMEQELMRTMQMHESAIPRVAGEEGLSVAGGTSNGKSEAGFAASAMAPCRVLFTLAETSSASASATKGGLVSRRFSGPKRVSSVNLYVGDSLFSSDYSYSGAGFVSPVVAPVENREVPIRNAFWFTADMAYKFAVDVFNSKKSNFKSASLTPAERALTDFYSLEEVVRAGDTDLPVIIGDADIPPVACAGLSDERCSDLAIRLSEVLNGFPELSASRVSVNDQVAYYYIVDNEDTRAKVPVSVAYVNVNGSVVDAAGKSVWDFENIAAPSFGELPSYEELVDKVSDFARRLAAVKGASAFDGYYLGPVLFEDDAVSAVFLNNLAGENGLFAYRKPVEVNSSVFPPEDVSRRVSLRTLESRMGDRVLDPALRVSNFSDFGAIDPSVVKRIKGLYGSGNPALLGSYSLDMQGVRPPDELLLVSGGVLKSVMSNRVPTLGSAQSTGSMRGGILEGGMSVSLAPGILVIDGCSGASVGLKSSRKSAGVAHSALRKELLKRAKSQGYEHAYIVRKYMEGGNQVVYRVSVKSGKEEVVLGAAVAQVPLNRLVNIGAKSFSRELSFENTMFRNTIPMSVIFPSALLLDDVEIRRQ